MKNHWQAAKTVGFIIKLYCYLLKENEVSNGSGREA